MSPGELWDEIVAANERWMDAYRRRDAKLVATYYTEDAQSFPPNENVVAGTEAIGDYWRAAMSSGVAALDLKSREVEAFGDTAYEVGETALMGEGGEALDHFDYLVIWKRVDGDWKIHREIWNSKPV